MLRASSACWLGLLIFSSCTGDAERPKASPERKAAASGLGPIQATDIGRFPAGWTPLVTNGDPAKTEWRVTQEKTAGDGVALALVRNENGREQFNLCVIDAFDCSDVDVEARCSGDSGVGLVWRCRDERCYYVFRVHPLEGNANLYKVVDGVRMRLGGAPLGLFEENAWYRLRVVARGDRFECYLDGKVVLDVRDASITAAGRVGVWTRGESLGRFAELRIRPAR
jgi:hypothetical protein